MLHRANCVTDHNGKAQITLTPEIGVSNKKIAASAFARVIAGGGNATVDCLDGTGLSDSVSAGREAVSDLVGTNSDYECFELNTYLFSCFPDYARIQLRSAPLAKLGRIA